MCYNHLGSQEEVNLALVHELIHAYDHCRGANVDWSNCEHHACSEVRCRQPFSLIRGSLKSQANPVLEIRAVAMCR